MSWLKRTVLHEGDEWPHGKDARDPFVLLAHPSGNQTALIVWSLTAEEPEGE